VTRAGAGRARWRSVAIAAACLSAGAAPRPPIPVLVEVSRYHFSPGGPDEPPIRLEAGRTYEITFRSTDVEHGVSAVPVLGIPEEIVVPGVDAVVTVAPTAVQVGRYNFACTRVCGAGHGGMHGTIEVVAGEPDSTLLLRGGRFQATAVCRTGASNPPEFAHAVALTVDSGYFWFFDAENVEVVLKVLDGCVTNGRYWVFAAGMTDLGVELEFRDMATGLRRVYDAAPGAPFAPIQDTAAFDSCP